MLIRTAISAFIAIIFGLRVAGVQATEMVSTTDRNPTGLSPAMAPLKGLIGHWRVVAWTQSTSGEWSALAPSEARYTPALAGFFIVGAGILNAVAGSLEFTETFAFDPFRKIYRMTWNDAAVGLMDVYQGEIKNRKLVVSNLESKTFWVTPDKESYAFKLEIDLDATNGRRNVSVFSSTDNGNEWSLFQRTEYESMESGD